MRPARALPDVGGGPELEPLQPEEPQPQPPQAQADGETDEPVDAEDAAGESYGAGQEHEPLKQQPSLARTPGASAAAAAAAGKRLRES